MVADEGAAEAVLHEPGGAVRAFVAVGAGAAEGERRVAPPVEEEERLLAAATVSSMARLQGRREPAALGNRLAPEIDGADLRQERAAEALGQAHMAVAPALHVDPGLDGRRRGGEDHGAFSIRPRTTAMSRAW